MEKEIEQKKLALEKELIEETAAYHKADFALRKGFDFRINAIKNKLNSLNHGFTSKMEEDK